MGCRGKGVRGAGAAKALPPMSAGRRSDFVFLWSKLVAERVVSWIYGIYIYIYIHIYIYSWLLFYFLFEIIILATSPSIGPGLLCRRTGASDYGSYICPGKVKASVLGIEPRTSRTRSENHTTRPNSQLSDGSSRVRLARADWQHAQPEIYVDRSVDRQGCTQRPDGDPLSVQRGERPGDRGSSGDEKKQTF